MDANLGRLLLDGFRWVDAALLAGLEDRLGIRLTSAQSQLFAEISLERSRQAELARLLGVSRQAVNELVRTLEAAGMVELVADPDSARSKLVKPTALGVESVRVGDATLELSELDGPVSVQWSVRGPEVDVSPPVGERTTATGASVGATYLVARLIAPDLIGQGDRIGTETLAAMRAGLAADWGDPGTAYGGGDRAERA